MAKNPAELRSTRLPTPNAASIDCVAAISMRITLSHGKVHAFNPKQQSAGARLLVC
jgi:hypothetical protein